MVSNKDFLFGRINAINDKEPQNVIHTNNEPNFSISKCSENNLYQCFYSFIEKRILNFKILFYVKVPCKIFSFLRKITLNKSKRYSERNHSW